MIYVPIISVDGGGDIVCQDYSPSVAMRYLRFWGVKENDL